MGKVYQARVADLQGQAPWGKGTGTSVGTGTLVVGLGNRSLKGSRGTGTASPALGILVLRSFHFEAADLLIVLADLGAAPPALSNVLQESISSKSCVVSLGVHKQLAVSG